ncbi:DUF6397 family protein [Streptomyces sp. NBC_01754]|uniref:DUF6397 family protein n=1 Tax=Streptomyces sp. NBC_01754 TaxID=2975930 RepID=UPI002DDB3C2C|nr:DUF6397 family protein [Streptomyces sp. NBC_01754]WSC96488.1 DUF6397 family protein [Streptomyces sp. NBC_01754]
MGEAGRGDAGARRPGAGDAVSAGRASLELGLKRGEFDIAVHLGLIGTEIPPRGGCHRVRREEIDRLRATAGGLDSLREEVRTAGTAEAASLLGISTVRFTGLARIGCFSPVAFCLNRYRAVVWLYLAGELTAFAAREPELLTGRVPAGMRTMLEAGSDLRARNWRARRADRLLSRTADPWARAAVRAAALDAVQLAEVVGDPYERAYLARLPSAGFGRPGSVSGREAMEQMVLADDPDEILWCRVNLSMELDRARESRAAPRPGGAGDPHGAATVTGGEGAVPTRRPGGEGGRAPGLGPRYRFAMATPRTPAPAAHPVRWGAGAGPASAGPWSLIGCQRLLRAGRVGPSGRC